MKHGGTEESEVTQIRVSSRDFPGDGVAGAKMRCGGGAERLPAAATAASWGARAASVYLCLLVSAIAVGEGASGGECCSAPQSVMTGHLVDLG